MTKKLSIEILWGDDPEREPILYQFDTSAEITAFRLGIEAASRDDMYEILYTDEE